MKIICIGRNYIEHAAELKNPVPERPMYFMKPDSAILRNNQPFFYPNFSTDVHHEVELVVHISRVGKHIGRAFAHRYFDRVGLGIDFTARDIQNQAKAKGHPWEQAKGFDQSAVIGRFIPIEQFADVQNIDFSLHKNNELVQQGNSRDMIFSIAEQIAYVSQFMTLKIGDLLYTGTPAGVGPVQIGDRLTGRIGTELCFDFLVK